MERVIPQPKKAMISNHRMDAKLGAILAKLVSIRGMADFERSTRPFLAEVLTEIRQLWVLARDKGVTSNLERAITSVRRAISIYDRAELLYDCSVQVQGAVNVAICAVRRAQMIFKRPHIKEGKV